MGIHKGSEGTVHVGTDAVAEIRSYSVEETADTLETTSMGDALTIDLDVDEPFVHQSRGGRIGEALVRHDVAPVTGGIANGQEDGNVSTRSL